MTKVLFVCHGNICRSPMGKYIFQNLIEQNHIDYIIVDSAATSREEIGNSVYPPAKRMLKEHGIDCDGHHARQVRMEEYEAVDYFIAMDNENVYNLKHLFDGDPLDKVHLLSEFGNFSGEVADPWYTGDFDITYRQITDGCEGLLKYICKANS